ncbi:unnamed protein product [Adineta steineri]|uniref:NHL repeat containing protein n=1 Tax=Adineta steineri TaxID=433720 RepID=A0A816FHU2_9BILA|nr:unnamed protein product [Adineta steineri]CAF1661809.1 unnamed protein product [Adineta steineri]
MEYKKLLIGKNEEDIEMAAKRASAYNASPECKSESERKNNTKQSTRPQTGSSLFHRKAILPLIMIVIISLIVIISITIWIIFIKKTEITTNTTTATTDVSTTETKILTTSTTMLITWSTKTSVHTISTTDNTMLTTSTNSHTTTKNDPKFNRWKQNASTVAGGNGEGQQLNQLNWPSGIFIDKNKTIFIADRWNNRIVKWKYNATTGQIIAGEYGRGQRINQLHSPADVIFDQQNHSIIIADFVNRRVIRWFNQNQQILIHNIDCYGLAMDKNGFLYVSDDIKNEVRRWKMGEYNNEGIVVAGGNGKGDQLNQLSTPSFIFVDEDQSVYVSDQHNHRVMKWRRDAKEGRIVAGGNAHGENHNQLFYPRGLTVNNLGQIFVADSENHRVMRWYEGKEEGEIVVGGNGQGNQTNQLNYPRGLSFDDEGNLYVADSGNDRIQKFEIIL